MELRFDAMLCSNLSNGKFDAGLDEIVPSFKFILHVHRQTNYCSESFFWKFSVRILLNTLKHLQSFVVAIIEQVQNIEKSTASTVEIASCCDTVKARIQ